MGILGQSGCGKSTLFSLVLRLYDTTSGEVRVSGRDVKDINPLFLREQIAIVTQDVCLPKKTVIDNLLYGVKDPTLTSPEDINRALRIAQCLFFLEDIERFPQQLHSPIGTNGDKLSGGERQVSKTTFQTHQTHSPSG